MTRKDELQKIVAGLQEQIEEIECQELIDLRETCIGKYYKRQDSCDYGAPWWVYYRVLGYGEHYFSAWRFCNASDGSIEIMPRTLWNHHTIIERAEEITQVEFDKAWNDLVKDIIAMRRTPSG
jgi:hypothetical protein